MNNASKIWAEFSALAPSWARLTAIVGGVAGLVLYTLCVMFDPPFHWRDVPNWGWPLLGMALVFPPVGLWKLVARPMLGINSEADRAREYIRVIKLAMVEANLNRTDQLFYWRGVFAKLGEEFRVGASPPPVTTMIEEAQRNPAQPS